MNPSLFSVVASPCAVSSSSCLFNSEYSFCSSEVNSPAFRRFSNSFILFSIFSLRSWSVSSGGAFMNPSLFSVVASPSAVSSLRSFLNCLYSICSSGVSFPRPFSNSSILFSILSLFSCGVSAVAVSAFPSLFSVVATPCAISVLSFSLNSSIPFSSLSIFSCGVSAVAVSVFPSLFSVVASP